MTSKGLRMPIMMMPLREPHKGAMLQSATGGMVGYIGLCNFYTIE
jgi:hypothetical protein